MRLAPRIDALEPYPLLGCPSLEPGAGDARQARGRLAP